MNTAAILGIFTCVAGLVFYFTSSAFSILSTPLEAVFQTLGIILMYISIALFIWFILNSIDIFSEGTERRE